jgi:lactoylglutathione lyase
MTDNKVRILSTPKTIKDGKKIMTAVDPNGVELDFIEE